MTDVGGLRGVRAVLVSQQKGTNFLFHLDGSIFLTHFFGFPTHFFSSYTRGSSGIYDV